MQVEQYCFRAPYLTALLRAGLGVPEPQVRIGSGDVAWTLGAHPVPASLRLWVHFAAKAKLSATLAWQEYTI